MNPVWLSRDSWEKIWYALHNIQLRIGSAIEQPAANLTGMGTAARLMVDLPEPPQRNVLWRCRISELETDRWELRFFTDHLSEVYYPGWTATIDGQPTEVGRANYVLRAINVPAGRHEVIFSFKPQSVKTTETIAYVALGVLVLLIVVACPFNEAASDWQKGVRNHMRATKNHNKSLTIVNIYIILGENTINVKIKEKVN